EADTKFVDVTGDTMSGTLKIRRSGTHLDLIDSGTSDKTWRLEIGGGNFKLTEVGVQTQFMINAGGIATFAGMVRSNAGFNVNGHTVIESDAKINWNKLKSVPSATTSAQGIVKLNNTLDSASQAEAATANTIKILKEMIDEKAGITGAIMNDLKIKNWIRIGNVILRPNPANKTLDFIWTDEPM
ncbi:MAG: tail fiber protein, partial [Aeromonas veronii]